MINKFSKFAGYEINMKNIVFLCPCNEQRKLRKYPVYNSIKKNKMLSNKFNQEVQDLYTENYKTLLKEMKENLNKWASHTHGL